MQSRGESISLVMDLGGNWIRVALATVGGDLVWRDRQPTDAEAGRQAVIDRVESLLTEAISHADGREVVGVGMALASPVDPESGIMYNPPNLPALDGVSFKSIWEQKLDCPVMVGNDATLAALGEYRYGSGSGARTLVYMTISTGIGGGVVIDGRPLMGAYGMAGELGHMCVDRNGPRCKCGHVGCLEIIASGTAIGDRARKQVEEGVGPVIRELVAGDLDRITSETVFEAATRGDTAAVAILDDVGAALGAGLVNILHIFNPDVIVLGGGVSSNWDYLRPSVESYIESHAMSHVLKSGFRLSISTLGDEIGLLGAAALVWQGSART